MTKKKPMTIGRRIGFKANAKSARKSNSTTLKALVDVPSEGKPATFGLVFTHTAGGQVVLGVQGPSFTIFRNKREAAEWLRNFSRLVEDSWPSS